MVPEGGWSVAPGGTAEVALTFGRKRCDDGGPEGNVNGMTDGGGEGEREETELNVRERR